MPVASALARRAAQVRERAGPRRRSGSAARSARGDGLGERGEERVLVLLDGVGRRPPEPAWLERAQGLEPVAARAAAGGRRAPVRSMAATRAPTDVSVELRCRARSASGSQNEASRAARAREMGARRRAGASGTRSSHLPMRVSSIGAVVARRGSSTTNTPGPRAGTGRPQGTGPSASSPTRAGAVTRRSWGRAPGDGTRDAARGIVRAAWHRTAAPPDCDPARRSRSLARGRPRAARVADHRDRSCRRQRLTQPISPQATAAVGDPAASEPRHHPRPRAVAVRPVRSRRSPLQPPPAQRCRAPDRGRPVALQARLDGIRKKYAIPGVSVTIIFPDGTTWVGVSGMADVEAGTPVTPDTAFAIASVSKTFTAALDHGPRRGGPARARRAGPDLPARPAHRPQGHGPPAARPHERPARLLLPPGHRRRSC